MKKIIFRADGNSQKGLGHLYRIFALAASCDGAYECALVTRDDSAKEIIPPTLPAGFIPAGLDLMAQPAWLEKKFGPAEHMIVLDGYDFNASYQKALKKLNYKLVYIDDLATEHMYADLVINHAPSATLKAYKAESYTRFALGTGFALVRPLFIEAARRPMKPKDRSTAFVCFGGSDPFDFTGLVCKSLLQIKNIKKINIVAGSAYGAKEIFELSEKDRRINIHRNLDESELLRVMEESCFAIVPTSTILFELCCVKMPILSGYYAENQKQAYFAFLEKGLIRGVGNFKETAVQEMENFIQELLNSDATLMVKNQASLFDGLQKERLVKILNTL